MIKIKSWNRHINWQKKGLLAYLALFLVILFFGACTTKTEQPQPYKPFPNFTQHNLYLVNKADTTYFKSFTSYLFGSQSKTLNATFTDSTTNNTCAALNLVGPTILNIEMPAITNDTLCNSVSDNPFTSVRLLKNGKLFLPVRYCLLITEIDSLTTKGTVDIVFNDTLKVTGSYSAVLCK